MLVSYRYICTNRKNKYAVKIKEKTIVFLNRVT